MNPGTRLEDRYRLEHLIAGHGTTRVWSGRDELLVRRVAVKVFGRRAGTRHRRLLQERAKAVARLAHPGVVTTYDYGETVRADGAVRPYLVTEFLDGETLAERLRRGVLPRDEAAAVVARVAGAVAVAHAAGIVHGRIGPETVQLTPDGAKVLGLEQLGPAGTRAEDDVRALLALLERCSGEAVPQSMRGTTAAEIAAALDAVPWENAPVAWARPRRRHRVATFGAAVAVVLLALVPLMVVLDSLRTADSAPTLAVPPPRMTVAPAPSEAPAESAEPTPSRAPVEADRPDAATAVDALARLRRAIDVGMATGEIRTRPGVELATLTTTLLNQLDAGTPVDLKRRVAYLRFAIAQGTPDDIAPARSVELAALLAETGG
ncbi:protein kinase domain-containing protein [Actinomadura hibisca]|uniref:protein kinase domain-containing protein n=1 Tax=Actinomadura hibisca TaxID=68565 RepID=UPI00082E68A6|nr:hypothetical protein [Actinomadura hibisca]